MKKICISIGHSQTVGGSVNEKFGVNEYKIAKPVCEMVANSLRDKLKGSYEVVLIDAGTIKKYASFKVGGIDNAAPDLAVELHFNSYAGTAKVEPSHPMVIYWGANDKAKVYARKIVDELDTLYAPMKWAKGITVGLPAAGYDMERYWLIHNTASLTMIIEAFFMRNDEQVDWAVNGKGNQEKLAKALTDGILKCVIGM